ncbi:sigma factor [Methylacidimicrobium sp. B4]|uniref:sigma factor n=1 Tax=Methylacidimicrobium sp. B4 TaxID=2796139 RepID=UPI001A8C05A9|nr:sigma factor [Methylacidimicrobium sp. B4]QSR85005.1 hypothetical protein MacB4_01665 [Methylacidimicrobium sp. B4]
MKLAEEPGCDEQSSTPIDWVKGVGAYQEALRQEKLALLAVPAARESLAERLLLLHEPSRQRRVNAAEVIALISLLRSHRSLALDGVLALLDRLKLNTFWWNDLREVAEGDGSFAAVEWRRCRMHVAAVAEPLVIAGLRIVRRFVTEQQRPEIQEAIRSDGIIGIYRALERFDPTRNSSFPQYAAYWVRNEIAAGALRARVVSLTGHSQRKVRRDAARLSDVEGDPPCPGPHLLSLDASGLAPGAEEEVGTLHEVLPDRKSEPRLVEGKELVGEWLEILRDCPISLRPFVALRYYYPAWEVEAACVVCGDDAFEALAPMARERLIAGTALREGLGSGVVRLPRESAKRKR